MLDEVFEMPEINTGNVRIICCKCDEHYAPDVHDCCPKCGYDEYAEFAFEFSEDQNLIN